METVFSDRFCLSVCPAVEVTSNDTVKSSAPSLLGYYNLLPGRLMNDRVIYASDISINNGTVFFLHSAQAGEFQGSWTVRLHLSHLVVIIITTKHFPERYRTNQLIYFRFRSRK